MALNIILVLMALVISHGYINIKCANSSPRTLYKAFPRDLKDVSFTERRMCEEGGAEGLEKKKKKKNVKIAKVNSGLKRSMSKSVAKKPKKKVRLAPPSPEFSRVVNIANIPERKSVLCRLVANPKECNSLAERFEIPEILSFASNVTVTREMSGIGLYVEGDFVVEIGSGSELLPTTEIVSSFETNLLINVDGSMSFEEATDYDDEVDESGDIDIGEIAAQYFGIEMYS